MRKTCFAVALALALPAILHAQDSEDEPTEKKEKRAQLIILFNSIQEIPSLDESGSFSRFLEQGSTSRTYTGGGSTAVEIGGMYAIMSRLSIGWSFELTEAIQDGTLDVSAPHPLLFDRNREVSHTVNELRYSEFTIHSVVAYRIATPRIEVELFAGPSFFETKAELIDRTTIKSEYPFDDISVSGGGGPVSLQDSAVGFNVGAGMAYYFTEILGASFSARFSQADLEVMREGGEPIAIKAGGFRLGGGLRIRF